MRFFALATLATAGCAAAFSRRDLGTVQGDLTTLDNELKQLGSDLAGYKGGYRLALGIYNEAQGVVATLSQATSDLKATSKLNAADSTTLVNQLAQVKPDIITALNNFAAAEPAFKGYNIANIAKSAGADIKTTTAGLVASFYSIIDASTQQQAAGILQDINNAFAAVDKAYASD